MHKELFVEIEIPDGVEANLEGNNFTIKGKEGELKRKFYAPSLEFKIEKNKIIVGNKNSTKREKKMMNTITAHLKNMIKGVQKKFEIKLKICFAHFPITVVVQGEIALIKNFLGEKNPRKCKIRKGAEVEVKGQEIIVKAIDREIAGQTAANFEKATWIRMRDRRVFQDGIFITNKAGKEM